MTATLRAVTLPEVSTLWLPRYTAEAAREKALDPSLVFADFGVGALEASWLGGAVMLVENADVRTVILADKGASASEVYVYYVLGLSTHLLDVFLATTNHLIGKGFVTAKFRVPANASPGNYSRQASTRTGATVVNGVASVPLSQARTRLIAAGAT